MLAINFSQVLLDWHRDVVTPHTPHCGTASLSGYLIASPKTQELEYLSPYSLWVVEGNQKGQGQSQEPYPQDLFFLLLKPRNNQ